MSTLPNPPLSAAAFELGRQIHEGKWSHILDRETHPAPENEVIIAELRRRCPGFERTAYRDALLTGIARAQALPPPTLRQHIGYWLVVFTFVWAPFVVMPLQKTFLHLPSLLEPFPYPAACGLAAIYLFRHRQGGSVLFAAINLIAGLSWIGYLAWALRAFAASFWR